MPDINFLPPEDLPKKRRGTNKEAKPLEFFRPHKEEPSATPQSVTSKSKRDKGKFWQTWFNKSKATPTDAPASKLNFFSRGNNFDVHKTRESLLQYVRGEQDNKKAVPPASSIPTIQAKDDNSENIAAASDKKQPEVNSKNIDRLQIKIKDSWPQVILSWWRKRLKKDKQRKDLLKQANQEPSKPAPALPAVPPASQTAPVIKPPIAAPLPRTSGYEDVLETNLIKGEEFVFFDWRKAIRANIISIVTCLVIIGGVWAYLWWLGKQTPLLFDIDRQNLTREQQQKKLAADVAQLNRLRAKMSAASALLEQHVYWTNFFTWLESNTLPGVYYESFEGDISGQYILPAQANSFSDIGRQMALWEQEKKYAVAVRTTKAELKTQLLAPVASSQSGLVAFDVNLTVKPEIFYQP